MEPLCAAARFSRAVQAVTFCTFRRLRPLCRLHRLDEAVLWLLPYLFFVLAALHGAARAKRLLCVFGCALLPPAGLTAPCLSSDAFGHSPLLLAVPYFFLLFAMTAFSPTKRPVLLAAGLAAAANALPVCRKYLHRGGGVIDFGGEWGTALLLMFLLPPASAGVLLWILCQAESGCGPSGAEAPPDGGQ